MNKLPLSIPSRPDLTLSLNDVFEIVLRCDQMPLQQKEEWLAQTARLLGIQPNAADGSLKIDN